MQQTGEKAPGHASPRMVLVLALVLATAFGPVWLSPAGAASSVVSSDIIPLNGEVGGIRLSGVVHVVTQFVVNAGSDDISVFVHTYLTPSDVTAVDRQGNTYLAHGAGTAAISFHDYQDVPYYFPPMPGFVFVGSGAGVGGGSLGNNAFAIRLHLSFLPTGELGTGTLSVQESTFPSTDALIQNNKYGNGLVQTSQ